MEADVLTALIEQYVIYHLCSSIFSVTSLRYKTKTGQEASSAHNVV